MDFTELVNQIAEHFQGKKVRNISMYCDEDPQFKERITPRTVRTSTMTINFTDDTSIIIDAVSEETGGVSPRCGHTRQIPRLSVSFWVGKQLVDEWVKRKDS